MVKITRIKEVYDYMKKTKLSDFLFVITVGLSTGLIVSMGINYVIHDASAFFHTNDNKQQEEKKKMIKIDSPKNLWYNLGRFYSEQGNFTGSISAFDRALSIDPNFIEALNSKAFVLRDFGNFTQAIQVFNQVVEKDSQHKWAWNNIGYSLLQLGNISDSIYYFDKAIKIDPEYTSALNNKATALLHSGNPNAAKSTFEKVIDIERQDKYALHNLEIIKDRLSNQSH